MSVAAAPGAQADHGDASLGREPLEVGGEVVPADELEDHVVGAARGCLCAELVELALVVPCACGDLGSEGDPELHPCHSDAAGGTVHEQALAGLQLGLREERVVRGRVDLDEAARLGPRQVLRHREGVRGVDGDELGVPAAREQRHHALAVLRLAGALEPGNVDRGARRRRVAARALGQVGAVHTGAADLDQELALLRDGIGALLEVEGASGDDSCAHSVMLRR